jgi:hypothetical protein
MRAPIRPANLKRVSCRLIEAQCPPEETGLHHVCEVLYAQYWLVIFTFLNVLLERSDLKSQLATYHIKQAE